MAPGGKRPCCSSLPADLAAATKVAKTINALPFISASLSGARKRIVGDLMTVHFLSTGQPVIPWWAYISFTLELSFIRCYSNTSVL